MKISSDERQYPMETMLDKTLHEMRLNPNNYFDQNILMQKKITDNPSEGAIILNRLRSDEFIKKCPQKITPGYKKTRAGKYCITQKGIAFISSCVGGYVKQAKEESRRLCAEKWKHWSVKANFILSGLLIGSIFCNVAQYYGFIPPANKNLPPNISHQETNRQDTTGNNDQKILNHPRLNVAAGIDSTKNKVHRK